MSGDIQFSARRIRRVKGGFLWGHKTAKRRVSLRVPGMVMAGVRRLAIDLDMPIAELCGLLISFAATANFLRLGKKEGLDSFLGSARLNRTMRAFGDIVGGHEPRVGTTGGQPISLRFPANFLEITSQYARLVGQSQSSLLLQFLEQGMRLYLQSWIAVTKAVTAGNKILRSDCTPPANKSEGTQDTKPTPQGIR